eukprot:4435449-Alexandrium_andersonii.AAC.1
MAEIGVGPALHNWIAVLLLRPRWKRGAQPARGTALGTSPTREGATTLAIVGRCSFAERSASTRSLTTAAAARISSGAISLTRGTGATRDGTRKGAQAKTTCARRR